MPELDYKAFAPHLKKLREAELTPVYLLWGEEFLCKTALEALLTTLFPSATGRLNYTAFADTGETVSEVIERLTTYSLLSAPKVVLLTDAKIFYSSLDAAAFLEKARAAYDADDLKKASRHLLDLFGRLKLTYEDLNDRETRNQRLKYDVETFGDDLWLTKTVAYCLDSGLPIPPAGDDADLLQRIIEKGFPDRNYLVITTDMIDRRRALYKCILNAGTIVNCFVPKGERRADKLAQTQVLAEQQRIVLSRAGKTISKEAAEALRDRTGFDLRTFRNNLEKLVSYAGNRGEIGLRDVEVVLERTKKDPLYELTNAVAERNLIQALSFMESLLSDNFHPLQILAAIGNQIRKLLMIRDFMESPYGESWQGLQTGYQQFREAVVPAMEAYDRRILDRLADWHQGAASGGADTGAQRPQRKGKIKTDLMIVKNPQNPYPIFQAAQKAQGFELRELQTALELLSEADLQLKSTPKNPRLILENVVFRICGKGRT